MTPRANPTLLKHRHTGWSCSSEWKADAATLLCRPPRTLGTERAGAGTSRWCECFLLKRERIRGFLGSQLRLYHYVRDDLGAVAPTDAVGRQTRRTSQSSECVLTDYRSDTSS